MCTVIFSCKTKELKKITFKKVQSNKKKEAFVNEKLYNIDSVLSKITLMNLPESSKYIESKVKYYDNIGGFFLDTTFTKVSISKLFSYVDNKKPILIVNKDILNISFNKQKSNIIDDDGIIFAYGNNEDYNYNIKSQIVFPVFKTEFKDFNLIGSYSQYFGENDIPGVFFILTSFDKKGSQLDYLIVFNRFSWESTIKKDFTIKKGTNVTTTKKVIDYFDDDLENEREKPLIIKKVENYIITEKGVFEKVKDKK